MAWVGSTVTGQVVALLSASAGLNACVATLAEAGNVTLPALGANQILAQNVSIDLTERSMDVQYPSVNVYCEKIVNQLKEKFRNFSGKAVMAIEVRVSGDRLDGIESQLQTYVDAATQVLDQNRGDWGEGMYYAGCYEAALGSVKHGSKNFIQVGKISFDVGVSD
jgi:phage tail protein X